MDKRLFIFILISLVIHLIILAQITFENKGGIKKDQPIIVDILKKDLESKEPPVNPKILSDRDIDLKKKTEKTEEKNESDLPVASEKGVQRDIVKKTPEEKSVSNKQVQQKKKVVTKREGEVVVEDKKQMLTEKKKNMVTTKEEKENAGSSIDKEKIGRILNPTDILKEIAKNEVPKLTEGEDEVNIEAMKFKYYSYFYKFQRLLYQVWEYPSRSIYNGEEGVVRIRFSILKDGKITNIRIVESSGYPDLDKAAVKALKTMRGIPLPESYKLNILHVDGYFAYHIYRMRIY
jgi:protein TonB